MKRSGTLAAVLAVAAVIAPHAEQTKFDLPSANGYRVDACRTWGAACGKDAADAFCRMSGYDGASAFEIDPRIGAKTPTMTIGDRKICNQPQCDGFKWITCTRADAAAGKRRGMPPAVQPEAQPSPPPQKPRVVIPPGLIEAMKKGGATAPPPPAPPAANPPPPAPPAANPPPPGAPAPGPTPPAPRPPTPAMLARLDPQEFLVLTPRSPTATLGRFGARAPSGELEDRRRVDVPLTPDLVQTGAADVDGDGQSEVLLLETEKPQKPEESQLHILKLGGDLEFQGLAVTGVNVGKGYPILTSGRLLGDKLDQALVYVPGEAAVVIGWRLAPATEIPVHYIKVQGWAPKGALMVLDANGDGQDDILDYSEAGSLDLVTLGPVELLAGGEGSTHAASRPILKLGPGHRFGIGDFTGDGRTDLLIHDSTTSTVSIAQFDGNGAIRSRTTVATDWPATYTWSRGFDYDGTGSDDLLVSDPSQGSLALVRFTSQGTLQDLKAIIPKGGNPENLRFPGYFMANGRASYLSHVRSLHRLVHYWFDVVGADVAPSNPLTILVEKVPEGALVVVGNFRKDR